MLQVMNVSCFKLVCTSADDVRLFGTFNCFETEDVNITEERVFNLLNSLDVRKRIGPD